MADTFVERAVERKIAATATTQAKPFGLSPEIFSSDYDRQESKSEFRRLMEKMESKILQPPPPEVVDSAYAVMMGMTR